MNQYCLVVGFTWADMTDPGRPTLETHSSTPRRQRGFRPRVRGRTEFAEPQTERPSKPPRSSVTGYGSLAGRSRGARVETGEMNRPRAGLTNGTLKVTRSETEAPAPHPGSGANDPAPPVKTSPACAQGNGRFNLGSAGNPHLSATAWKAKGLRVPVWGVDRIRGDANRTARRNPRDLWSPATVRRLDIHGGEVVGREKEKGREGDPHSGHLRHSKRA